MKKRLCRARFAVLSPFMILLVALSSSVASAQRISKQTKSRRILGKPAKISTWRARNTEFIHESTTNAPGTKLWVRSARRLGSKDGVVVGAIGGSKLRGTQTTLADGTVVTKTKTVDNSVKTERRHSPNGNVRQTRRVSGATLRSTKWNWGNSRMLHLTITAADGTKIAESRSRIGAAE